MELTKRVSSCSIAVPVWYGAFDYEGEGKRKYKVWSNTDFIAILKRIEDSCTEEQQESLTQRLLSLTVANREEVLSWCSFLKHDGAEWNKNFLFGIDQFEQFQKNARFCLKEKARIGYDSVKLSEGYSEADGMDCDSLESDERGAVLLTLIGLLKFAIETDEWVLACIVLEHFNRAEIRDFLVHMFQPQYVKSASIFFQFPSGKPLKEGGFADLSLRLGARMWDVFHGLLPFVTQKLSDTRLTLQEIHESFLREEEIVPACLIWSSTLIKAREKWGSIEYLNKNLFKRHEVN